MNIVHPVIDAYVGKTPRLQKPAQAINRSYLGASVLRVNKVLAGKHHDVANNSGNVVHTTSVNTTATNSTTATPRVSTSSTSSTSFLCFSMHNSSEINGCRYGQQSNIITLVSILTETRHTMGQDVALWRLTPPGYTFIDLSRLDATGVSTNHSGLRLSVSDGMKCKVITTSLQLSTFKLMLYSDPFRQYDRCFTHLLFQLSTSYRVIFLRAYLLHGGNSFLQVSYYRSWGL